MLAASFRAVDRLLEALEARHVLLLRRNWIGRFRLEVSSLTHPDPDFVLRIERHSRDRRYKIHECHELDLHSPDWALWLPVTNRRGTVVTAFVAIRRRPWRDADMQRAINCAKAFASAA